MKTTLSYLLLIISLLTAFLHCITSSQYDSSIEDNEFAEFEEFDEEDPVHPNANPDQHDTYLGSESKQSSNEQRQQQQQQQQQKWSQYPDNTAEDDDATVETEDDDNDFLNDDEEFEGFEDKERNFGKGKSHEASPALTIPNIPYHLHTNWDSFYMEMLMLGGLCAYFLNFLAGKSKNHKLAQAWLNAHKELLYSNFFIVGDDGATKDAQSGMLLKESENVYILWCSGRVYVEGMLVELKFLKRQDLVNTIARALKPSADQIVVTVDMEPNTMDKFVCCVAQKKSCIKLHRDMYDLSQFCTEKKNAEKFDLPSSYQILSEIGEATSAVIDKRVQHILTKYEGLVEYIHFSDMYSGPKNQDESVPQKMPTSRPVLIFCFNVSGKGHTSTADMESMKPLMQMIFHCIDKVSRMQLSKDARQKAEKNRQKAEEAFLKAAHAQRQEAAQLRREEKRRAEKEKMMNEDDPDKTRKWEERENKRDLKKKQPKMKRMTLS
ncbi:coiled-coil domain-containing protein 47-like [Argonauta hians]